MNPHDRYEMQRGAKTSRIKGDLLHYSYYEVEEHLLQLEKFSTIQARSYYEMGIRSTVVKKWIHTAWRFVFDYLFRLGFLAGKEGYLISKLGAREVRLKYEKLARL